MRSTRSSPQTTQSRSPIQSSQHLVSAQATEVLFCINGDIPQSACFTATDLAQLPRTTLTVRDHDGICIAYEGVLLREILQRLSEME